MTPYLSTLTIGTLALHPALSPWKTEYTVNHAGSGTDAITIEYENTEDAPSMTAVSGGSYASISNSSVVWLNQNGTGAFFKIGWQDSTQYTIHLVNSAT